MGGFQADIKTFWKGFREQTLSACESSMMLEIDIIDEMWRGPFGF